MVVVGNAGAEYPTRGFVEACDAQTGKLVWRFHTTAAPGRARRQEPGAAIAGNIGGGSVWNTPAVDPKNDLMLFAIGNPNPDYLGREPQGRQCLYRLHRRGACQDRQAAPGGTSRCRTMCGTMTAAAPVILFDAKDENGKIVPAAAEAGKVGNVFIVNRLTGKLLHKSDAFVQQSREHVHHVPATTPVTRYPGINGGNLWSPAAYSPLTHNFYVMGEQPGLYRDRFTRSSQYVPGTPTVGQHGGRHRSGPRPRINIPIDGTLTAINVDTGKIAWQQKSDRPMFGGVLATASNLVFTGEMNGNFRRL